MKFTLRKKIVAGAVAAATVVGLGGAAVAYWTASGSGSGSGTVSTPASTSTGITVSGTVGALSPGATAAVTVTVHNGNTYSINGGVVTGSAITVDNTHASNGCLVGDFTFGSATSATTGRVLAGADAHPAGITITMADTALNQDACQGATVGLTLTMAQGS